jgi:hypothetical protein
MKPKQGRTPPDVSGGAADRAWQVLMESLPAPPDGCRYHWASNDRGHTLSLDRHRHLIHVRSEGSRFRIYQIDYDLPERSTVLPICLVPSLREAKALGERVAYAEYGGPTPTYPPRDPWRERTVNDRIALAKVEGTMKAYSISRQAGAGVEE